MREQRWNAVGGLATTSLSKEKYKAGGETGSNSTVAGIDEQEQNMSDKLLDDI